MKKLLSVAIGTLVLGAGAAHAGGCSYGKQQASIAKAEPAAETVIQDKQDPDLLALSKKREASEETDVVVQN